MAGEEQLLVEDREVVITPSLYVRCDGGSAPLGHPMEYITLEKNGEAICKYCGRRYVHAANPEAGALRQQGRGVRSRSPARNRFVRPARPAARPSA